MKPNKLYLYLTKKLTSFEKSVQIRKDKFFSRKDSERRNYVMYELGIDRRAILKTATQQFTLKGHHISFYEKEDQNNPYLSQYHYTAYFEGNDNKEYQLHVYFDQNDQLTTDTVMSLKGGDGTFTRFEINPELSNNLKQIAIDNSHNFMSEIRQHYNKNLKELETSYNNLLQELEKLSTNIAANLQTYQANVTIIIDVLMELADYHTNPNFLSILKLFTHITDSLATVPTIPITASNITDDVEPVHEPAAKHEEEDIPIVSRKPIKALIERALAYQETYFNTPKSETYEKRVQSFSLFLAAIQDALIATEDNNFYTTTEDLMQIQALITKNTEGAKKLLTELLLNNQFEQAKSLRIFLDLITSELIKMSLTAGNAKLLDFLLENTDFPINTFLVTGNLTPVLFCFYKHTEKTPKVECLSVLIKHNASLMVKTTEGLPVAHQILTIPHHPLKRALLDNPGKAIANQLFFKSLINEIENYIALAVGTVDQKLLYALDGYKSTLKLIGQYKSPSASKQIALASEINTQLEDQLKKSTIEMLRIDEEIQARYIRYQTVYKTYVAKLSKQEQLQFTRQGLKHANDLNELLKFVDQNSIDIKEATIKAINDYTQIILLRDDLLDIQKQLRIPQHKKKVQALHAQQATLITEINILEAPHLQASKINEQLNTLSSLEGLTSAAKEDNDENSVIDISILAKLGKYISTLDELTKVTNPDARTLAQSLSSNWTTPVNSNFARNENSKSEPENFKSVNQPIP